MQLFNIGAEGQLYLGAVGAAWIALKLGDHGVVSTPLYVVLMCAAAALLGGLWALIPGVLRAFANTNEIITSLMLNYVAGYLLTYLIFDSSSYWRDTSSLQARSFPQGKPMPDASNWYAFGSSVVVPLGFLIGLAAATVIWILYSRTRFGFEVSVIADSPRAARYAGMRTRRKILAVMALSGAVAGLGGASQIGEFAHTLDGSPSGLQAGGVRLYGDRRRSPGPLQPLRSVRRCSPHRRAAERGVVSPGARLPVRPRRRDAGDHPLLRSGRRALHPLPAAFYPPCSRRSGHAGARRVSVNNALLVVVLTQAVQYGTPLLYASLGELLAERSGVLNLGVEGMMLFGAATGYWATQHVHGSDAAVLMFAVLAAGVGGAAMAAIHAFLTITMRASQIVSGLALTIFAGGLGLSAYFGNEVHLADSPPAHQFGAINVFGLKDLWVFGPILFNQSALVYASWALTAGIAFYLARTRWGLNVRAVGEAPASADAMGINVSLYRYVHVLAGGALAGVAGACFSLSITPGWTAGDMLVGGAGWIAIALVIFAFWRAELCLVGAYLFGGLAALPFALQAHEVHVTPEFLNALPYVMTIVVLVIVSTSFAKRRLGAPAALGVPYVREER